MEDKRTNRQVNLNQMLLVTRREVSEHSCSSQEADPLQRHTIESPLQEQTRATLSHHRQRISGVLIYKSNLYTFFPMCKQEPKSRSPMAWKGHPMREVNLYLVAHLPLPLHPQAFPSNYKVF